MPAISSHPRYLLSEIAADVGFVQGQLARGHIGSDSLGIYLRLQEVGGRFSHRLCLEFCHKTFVGYTSHLIRLDRRSNAHQIAAELLIGACRTYRSVQMREYFDRSVI